MTLQYSPLKIGYGRSVQHFLDRCGQSVWRHNVPFHLLEAPAAYPFSCCLFVGISVQHPHCTVPAIAFLFTVPMLAMGPLLVLEPSIYPPEFPYPRLGWRQGHKGSNSRKLLLQHPVVTASPTHEGDIDNVANSDTTSSPVIIPLCPPGCGATQTRVHAITPVPAPAWGLRYMVTQSRIHAINITSPNVITSPTACLHPKSHGKLSARIRRISPRLTLKHVITAGVVKS